MGGENGEETETAPAQAKKDESRVKLHKHFTESNLFRQQSQNLLRSLVASPSKADDGSATTTTATQSPPSPGKGCFLNMTGRESSLRLFHGSSVAKAEKWDAVFDSPGPQAYDEEGQWKLVRHHSPVCTFDSGQEGAEEKIPGVGDYNVGRKGPSSKMETIPRARVRDYESPTRRYDGPSKTSNPSPNPMFPVKHHGNGKFYCAQQSALQFQSLGGHMSAPAYSFGSSARFGGNSSRCTSSRSALPRNTAGTREALLLECRPGGADKYKTKKKKGKKNKRRRGGGGLGRNTKVFSSRSSYDLYSKGGRAVTAEGSLRGDFTANFALAKGKPKKQTCSPGPCSYDQADYDRNIGGRCSRTARIDLCRRARLPRGHLFAEEQVAVRLDSPSPEEYDVDIGQRLNTEALQLLARQEWGEGHCFSSDLAAQAMLAGNRDRLARVLDSSTKFSARCSTTFGSGTRATVMSREYPGHLIAQDHLLGLESPGPQRYAPPP